MSGGRFDYQQWRINDIAEQVKDVIGLNRVKIPIEQRDPYDFNDDGTLKSWVPECYYDYPDEVIEKFKEGYIALRKAYIWAQRIDWLLSGDDGEESFIRRLKDDFEELDKELNEE